jgi:hypothetical protein
MGSDIHAFMEKTTSNGAFWSFMHKIDLNRSYDMFSLLCGVRDYYRCTPILSDIRTPSNLSPFVAEKIEEWESDGYGFSELTGKQIKAYKFWNTPFPDTRQPITDKNCSIDSKSGGFSIDELPDVNPLDFKLETPQSILDHNPDYKTIFEELKADPTLRMVFFFDC